VRKEERRLAAQGQQERRCNVPEHGGSAQAARVPLPNMNSFDSRSILTRPLAAMERAPGFVYYSSICNLSSPIFPRQLALVREGGKAGACAKYGQHSPSCWLHCVARPSSAEGSQRSHALSTTSARRTSLHTNTRIHTHTHTPLLSRACARAAGRPMMRARPQKWRRSSARAKAADPPKASLPATMTAAITASSASFFGNRALKWPAYPRPVSMVKARPTRPCSRMRPQAKLP
jgi:hypothetical protein